MHASLFRRCAYRALLVLMTGCSHHGSRSGAITPTAATTLVPWREYELANTGIYLRFPVEPADRMAIRRGSDERGPAMTSRSLIAADRGLEFGCGITRADGQRGSPSPAQVISALFKGTPTIEPAMALGDYPGERLVGTSPEGKSSTAVVYPLADGVLIAWVDLRTTTSPDLVSQFFGSLRIAPRWEVRAAEPLGVAVAVPALASEVSMATRVDFTVAGNHGVRYTVATAPLPPVATSSSRVDDVTAPEGHAISSTSVQHDGLPGREWVVERERHYLRARVLATASRLTFFYVVASSLDRIDDADARRFLDSARIF